MVRGIRKRGSNRKADPTVPESGLSNFPVRLRLTIPAGTSLEAFAEKIGVSISGLKKWLAGKAEPGLRYLCAIADVTDASLNWLCGREVSTPRDCDYEIERLQALVARLEEPHAPENQEKIDRCNNDIQRTERMRSAMMRERALLAEASMSGLTLPLAVALDAAALSDIVRTV